MKALLRALGVGAALLGGAAVPAFAQHTHAAGPAVGVPTCQPSQLTITPDGGSAGLGHVGVQFRLRNRSAQTCGMVGYPGAQLLDVRRRPLHTYVRWGPGYLSGRRPLRLVRLAPGGAAYTVLEYVDNPSRGQICYSSHGLLITPPNDYSSIYVPTALKDVCGLQLTAGPVEPTPYVGFQ